MSRGMLAMALEITPALDYESGDIFGLPKDKPLSLPKRNTPIYKQNCPPKQQHEFTIKGVKILATSRKDAIKRYNHIKSKYGE